MKRMLIDDTQPEETRVVIVDGNKVEDVEFESSFRKQIKGNVFVAKVIRIEPSLQAAFVDYGGNRHGFLAFSEIHPDYYNVSDEVKAEVAAEVDEIIERKRQYLADKKAEQERRRLEREQKRAEYEARKLTEEAEALARENQGSENTTEDESEKTTKVDSVEETIAKADGELSTSNDIIEENKEENVEENNKCVNDSSCECCDEKQEEVLNNETQVEDSLETTSDTKLENNEEETPEDVPSEEGDSSQPHPRRRKTRFLGRRGSRGKYKVSAEAAGLRNEEMISEEIDENEALDDDNEEENIIKAYDNDNEGGLDAEDENNERYLEIQRKLIFARKLYHHSTIQDVIKEGQTLLIQIVKEERGNKGAACTTYLSLAGRYCVLMPNRIKSGGVSRKITSATDRKRLKDILQELPLCDEMSLIIRTAGEDKKRSDIIKDYNYLIRTWDSIRHLALNSQVPALIYEEGNLIKRALRDMYTKDIDEVIIDGDAAYKTAKDFCKILSPSMGKKIKCRKPNEIPVFQHYQIEKELDKLHSPIVQLESGGYLVINPTEALVSIDVNSGRATHEMDIEETALKTNLEAADEIAKQLRMRNLAGLIVVDFIDMDEPANNHAIEKRMKEAMKPDRARVQIAKMSIFGLLEISRQRMHSSFIESNYTPCPYCRGQGVQRTTESSATLILRALEEEGIKAAYNHFEVRLPFDIATYILNHKRRQLADLEEKYGIEIIISSDSTIKNISDYKMERTKVIKIKPENTTVMTAYDEEIGNTEEDDEIADDDRVKNDGKNETSYNNYNRTYRNKKGRKEHRGYQKSYVESEKNNKIEEKTEDEKPKEKKAWWRKLIG